MSDGFVIMVDFRLRPGSEADFRAMVEDNARASVRDERGCRRFDVIVPQDDPGRVLLYEIYDDKVAFEEHCRTTHFARFDRQSASLVEKKDIIRGVLVCEG